MSDPAALAAAVLDEEERRLAGAAAARPTGAVTPIRLDVLWRACVVLLAATPAATAAGVGWGYALVLTVGFALATGVAALMARDAELGWNAALAVARRGTSAGRLRLAAVGLGAALVGAPVAAGSHRGAAGVAALVAAVLLALAPRRPPPELTALALVVVAVPAAYVPVLGGALVPVLGGVALLEVLAFTATVAPPRVRPVALSAALLRAAAIGGIGGAFVARALVEAHGRPVGMAVVTAAGALLAVAGVRAAEPWVGVDAAGAIRQPLVEADNDLALEVRHLDFSYGQVQVLFDVDLTVARGEVLALLGTNGAGKSTLLRAISGLGRPDRGIVRLLGRPITHLEAGERVRRGLVQMPGGHCVFPELTVADNLRAGAYTFIWDRSRVAERIDRAVDLFPVLGRRLEQPAGTLSGGEQQMLGLASALLLEPEVLLIDELSLGLAPIVVQELLTVIERLKADGLTIVIVEQSLNVALAVADRAVFMEKGQVRFEGAAADLLERDDLVRAVFLGGEGG